MIEQVEMGKFDANFGILLKKLFTMKFTKQFMVKIKKVGSVHSNKQENVWVC